MGSVGLSTSPRRWRKREPSRKSIMRRTTATSGVRDTTCPTKGRNGSKKDFSCERRSGRKGPLCTPEGHLPTLESSGRSSYHATVIVWGTLAGAAAMACSRVAGRRCINRRSSVGVTHAPFARESRQRWLWGTDAIAWRNNPPFAIFHGCAGCGTALPHVATS